MYFQTVSYSSHGSVGGGPVVNKSEVDLFLQAIKEDNLTTIYRLLADNPHLRKYKDAEGNTFLHIAISTCNVVAFGALAGKGFDINIPNNKGKSPLAVALDNYHSQLNKHTDIAAGYQAIIKGLVEDGAVPAKGTNEESSLVNAFICDAVVINNTADLKQFLEGNKFDLNQPDSQGRLPLSVVKESFSAEQKKEIIAILIAHGAEPKYLTLGDKFVLNLIDNSFPATGKTDKCCISSEQIKSEYNRKQKNGDFFYGYTFLHHLVSSSDYLPFLKDFEFNVEELNARNHDGLNCLTSLAFYNTDKSQGDVLDAMLYLISQGARFDDTYPYLQSELVMTALKAWHTPGFCKKFKKLIEEYQLNPHFLSIGGLLPLKRAEEIITDKKIKNEVIRIIDGFSLHSKQADELQKLPIRKFERACYAADLEVVKDLIKKHPKLMEVKDNSGNTFLHNAVLQNYLRLVELFINQGANPNNCNTKGQNCLSLAIQRYHNSNGDMSTETLAMYKLLLQKGARLQRGTQEEGTLVNSFIRGIHCEKSVDQLKNLIKKYRLNPKQAGYDGLSASQCVEKYVREEFKEKTHSMLRTFEKTGVSKDTPVLENAPQASSHSELKPFYEAIKGKNLPGIETIALSSDETFLEVRCLDEKSYQFAIEFFESKKTETKSWFDVSNLAPLQFKAILRPGLKLSKSQIDKFFRDFRRDYTANVLKPKQSTESSTSTSNTSPKTASTENNTQAKTVSTMVRLSGPVDLPIQVRRPDPKAKTRNQAKTEAIQEKLGRKNALAAPYAKGVKTESKPKPAPKKPSVKASQKLLDLSKKIKATPMPYQPEQVMDARRGGETLKSEVKEEAPKTSKKEEQVSLNEQQQQLNQKVIQRLAAAIRAFGNFRDFYNRVYKRQDYSLDKPETKTWVVNTFEEHLLQIFEGIIDTSENAPSPLFDTEKRLTKLLNNHFIPKAELEQLRYRLRHAFHTRDEADILELVKILKTKKARRRLRQLTTTTEPAFSIAKCNLLTRPSKKLTDTRAVLNELNRQFAIFKGITESWKPLFEYSDKLDGDLRDAAKKIFSNMAELVSKLPEAHPLRKNSLINSIRSAGNRNAHELDRLNLEGGGGEIPAISSEFLYKFKENEHLLKSVQRLIDRAIRDLDEKEKQ